jgi:hypothetical protein
MPSRAAQNQLNITAVTGTNQGGPLNGESSRAFTVKIESSTNFAPGEATVSADLGFDADKKVKKGTEVLLNAIGEGAQSTMGGKAYPQTANTLTVGVRPYNKTWDFGGNEYEFGHINFRVKDSQGHVQSGVLNNVYIHSYKNIPAGAQGISNEGWVQRLTVNVPPE